MVTKLKTYTNTTLVGQMNERTGLAGRDILRRSLMCCLGSPGSRKRSLVLYVRDATLATSVLNAYNVLTPWELPLIIRQFIHKYIYKQFIILMNMGKNEIVTS